MKTEYKKMLMASLFVMMSLMAVAASVSLEEAHARATSFLSSRQHAKMAPGVGQASLRLIHAESSVVNPMATDYYIFQSGDDESKGQFVIVAGDDRANAILGYGDGPLDMKDLPCGLEWLLGHYTEQMEWLHANPDAAVEAPAYASSGTIDPLLSCNWSQGEPYNNLCPIYKNQHCVTGCIATAMAQVMYYWQYPDTLPDLPAYVTGEISVSALPGTRLNWDDMLDGYMLEGIVPLYYSDAQGEAVATLMRYCGQATKMGYGVDASGSGSWNQMSGITDFGYNAGSRKLHRDNYSADDWKALMLGELYAHQPILYCGHGEAGGHAFVVDGYDGRQFHINWGWEGSGNGYFSMDAFTVYGVYDFNYNQSMLVGVYPTRYKPPYDVQVDGFSYRRHGNELTVTRQAEWDNTYRGILTIPSHVTIDGEDCVVTEIGNSAFKNCTSIRTINLPETLKRIGKYAFKNCTALTAMTLPNGLESIDFAAFQGCSSIRTFKFGAGLKHISSYAFYDCRGIQELDLPNRVESIDRHAFLNCKGLRTLTIDMTTIPDESFYYCNNLKTVNLGNHVKTIGELAFGDCWSLTDLNFGANVDSIAPMAFAGSTALTSIRRLPVVPPLVADENSFSETTYSRATLYVPESAWLDYYCCDVWTLFENQVIEPDALQGDCNLDGAVNIADVNMVINDILRGTMSPACDVNGDGSVNIADVNYIIGVILGS